MDKPVKEIKSKSEIRRFFNNKIINSEKVVIGGKTMYMTVNKIDDSGKEVKHKKNTKSKIREKRTEMNQTLNFPDIDYQKSKLPELKKNNVDKSIITNTRKIGHVYKGFEFLNELEEYLFERISSFSNIKEISDEELIDIFHNIQIWGGRNGRQVYVTNKKKFPDNYKKRFEFNFSINTYRKLVFRCLNLNKNKHRNTDWIRNITEWNYLSHSEMSGFKTSFSTKHLRFWLYSSLKEETLPIFDDVIERGFNEINTFNLNRENPEHLEFYWKQMIEKSKKEEISLIKLERLLFNYWR